MTRAFLLFFALYVVYALWQNLVRRAPEVQRLTPLAALLQAPLFFTAAWLAVRSGSVSRDLVYLPVIMAALVAGHLLFLLSLLGTDRQPREALRHFASVRSIVSFLANDPQTLFRVFGVSFSEEVIYRVAAQPLLINGMGSAAVGILLAAAAFCVVHGHYFRNPWDQSIEFSIFALLLGTLYFLTGDLIAVALIHAVRNWEIAYLEHTLSGQDDAPHSPATAQPILMSGHA